MFGGIADKSLNVFFVARRDGPERRDLEDARVRTVESTGQGIEKKLALEETAQIYANSVGLLSFQVVASPIPLSFDRSPGICRLYSFATHLFLTISFPDSKVEGTMLGKDLETAKLRLAPIANDHVTHPEIEKTVNKCGA